jgi:hypothetical protein
MFPNFRLVMAALVCTLGVAVAFAFVSVRVAHDTMVPRPTQPPSVFQQTLLSASDISFSTMAFNQPTPVISAIPYAEEPHPADLGFAIAPDPQTPASATVTADVADRLAADSPAPAVSAKAADVTVAAIAPATIEQPVTQPVTAPVVDPIPVVPAMPVPVAEAPADSVPTIEPQTKIAAVEQEPAKAQDLTSKDVAPPVVTSAPATESQTQDTAQDAVKDASRDAADALPESAPVVVASVPDDASQGGKTTTSNDQNIEQEIGQSAVIADTRSVRLPTPNPKFAALLNASATDGAAAKLPEAAKAEKEKPAKLASANPAKPKAASKVTARASAKPAKKVKKRVVVRSRPAPAAAAKPAAAAANAPFSLFGN